MIRILSGWRQPFIFIALLLCFGGSAFVSPHSAADQRSFAPATYIVQGASAPAAAAAVTQAGGTVVRQLGIIDGVSARLDGPALGRLRQQPQIALYPDRSVQATGAISAPLSSSDAETDTDGYLLYPAAATGAHLLHGRKITTPRSECKDRQVRALSGTSDLELRGRGVTVAVVDSGFMQMASLNDWKYKDTTTGTLVAENSGRCIVYRDFLPRTTANNNVGIQTYNSTDQNGHGTHVISTIADNRETPLAKNLSSTPVGVAPQVNLMIARVLERDGSGSYGDVIAAIDWIVANRTTYNVRVLNLSLYSPVTGPYWLDPLNQAVMKAWQAGITVVVAAGNEGAEAATITAPGNVPYVITVGAIKSGRYTESGSDELAFYSSRGPTESAFVKPDVVVPASRTIAPMPTDSLLAGQVSAGRIQETARVDYKIGSPAREHAYYQLSGTSMAAAEVSGIAALMLQANPGLTNNQLKYRLLVTARAAVDGATNQPVYSVWEQGAGLVDTSAAVFATTTEAANQGMDIALDLTSDTHYWGYTTWDPATGEFILVDENGTPLEVWDGAGRSWAGAGRSWAGAGRSWAGAGRSWAGSESLWAGAGRSWAGSTPQTSLTTASYAELLVRDEAYTLALPRIEQ